MKKFIINILAMTSIAALAGEMRTQKDDFTGKTTVSFVSTELEAQKSKVIVLINKGRNGNVAVFISPYPRQVTDCKNQDILLKDAKGSIHKIGAYQIDYTACKFQIKAEHIDQSFDVRLPMYRGANLDFSFSTKEIEIDQLTE